MSSPAKKTNADATQPGAHYYSGSSGQVSVSDGASEGGSSDSDSLVDEVNSSNNGNESASDDSEGSQHDETYFDQQQQQNVNEQPVGCGDDDDLSSEYSASSSSPSSPSDNEGEYSDADEDDASDAGKPDHHSKNESGKGTKNGSHIKDSNHRVNNGENKSHGSDNVHNNDSNDDKGSDSNNSDREHDESEESEDGDGDESVASDGSSSVSGLEDDLPIAVISQQIIVNELDPTLTKDVVDSDSELSDFSLDEVVAEARSSSTTIQNQQQGMKQRRAYSITQYNHDGEANGGHYSHKHKHRSHQKHKHDSAARWSSDGEDYSSEDSDDDDDNCSQTSGETKASSRATLSSRMRRLYLTVRSGGNSSISNGKETSTSTTSGGNNHSPLTRFLIHQTKTARRMVEPVVVALGEVGFVKEAKHAVASQLTQLKGDVAALRAVETKRRRTKQKVSVSWLTTQSTQAKKSAGRVCGALSFMLLMLLIALVGGSAMVSTWTNSGHRSGQTNSNTLFDSRWLHTRSLNHTQLLNMIHVHQHKPYNDSTLYPVTVKKWPGLDKPSYLTQTSKELVQVKRPAVRKKRPDEPRAVRTFGCLRDGCRGLAIEDLLDRGWQMRFRAAQNKDTYKAINYRVTFLLTDTTQLNHMKKVRPDLYQNIYMDYEKKSYLTAFDGGDNIGGNKGQQIKVKERFSRKYGCKYNDLAISPSSYRLYLVGECNDVSNMGNSGLTWLIKPETGSQGQGITFHTDISDVKRKVPQFFPCAKKEYKPTERYLVQEYIDKPLLLKKSKFDVRVYMLIASSSPYLLFYHEGYLRRALAEYSAQSKDRKVYLTNTHFQSMKKGFKLSDHIWPFSTMQDHLRDHSRTGGHYVEAILNPYIKKVLTFIFQTARNKFKKRKGTFHIFGIDFMIDANWHPWFIEANGYPGYTWSINFDTRNMVEEQFNLAQQVHENPRFFMLMQPGDRYGHFEMLFNELDEERTQKAYNPCEEFKDNRGYSAPLKEANKRFAKFSGAGGRTDVIKSMTSSILGAEHLGGARHLQVRSRRKLFNKYACDADSLRFSPPMHLLFDAQECEAFVNEAGMSSKKESWMLKPVVSPGDGKDLEVVMTAEEVKTKLNLGDACHARVADYVVQQYVPKRALIANKYWDFKVYMLIASTQPHMVFLHHGFARSVRLINGVGDVVTGSAGDGGDDDDDDDDDDAEEEEEEEEKSNDEDEEAKVQADHAKSQASDVSMSPGGEGGGVDGTGGDTEGEEEEKEEEPWGPTYAELNSGTTLRIGENFMTMDAFEDMAARKGILGARYMSSVFDTYTKRVAHMLFQAVRDDLVRANNTYQVTSLNFFLDEKLALHFAGARNVVPDAMPDVDELSAHKANMLETMAGLVLEVKDMPAAFARMRRGDSYGEWRMVFSEMEEHQRQPVFDPCDEFKRNLMVSKGSLGKNAWLHNYAEKRHAANKRELRKYIDKKWRESCRGRPTKELQAACIRNTISYRYKLYLEKEGVEYQDGFVDMTIRDLQKNAANSDGGGGGGNGGGVS